MSSSLTNNSIVGLQTLRSSTTKDDINNEGFKGCRISPDGTCILTAQQNILQLYDTNVYESHSDQDDMEFSTAMNLTLSAKESESIYGFDWYPLMDSTEPATCCFASISRGSPVHLWDAYESNKLRASYNLKDERDQMCWGVSVAMNESSVMAGSKSKIFFWDINRPGDPSLIKRPSNDDLSGIVASITPDHTSKLIAAGSYNGSFALFDKDVRSKAAFAGRVPSGITQMVFSECGTRLFIGTRTSTELTCWDVRFKRKDPLFSIPRRCTNNQRLQFSVWRDVNTGFEFVASGESKSNKIVIYETMGDMPRQIENKELELELTVNGVDVHLETGTMALSTGSRMVSSIFDTDSSSSSDAADDEEEDEEKHDNNDYTIDRRKRMKQMVPSNNKLHLLRIVV